MQLSIETNFRDVARELDRAGKQARFAAMQALNDTGFKVRDALHKEMDQKFDRVTPYIKRSIFVTRATKAKLEVVIEPRYMGGKGVDPKNVLQASIYGGARKHKRSEVALRRVGILPVGYSIVPGRAVPLDQYGNVRGSFLVQLISYFKAFSEQGYRANMTDKRKAGLAKFGKSANGYRTINGVVYFIAYGKLRSGKTSHLHPGIWARTGIHGSDIKPILMFVRDPKYRQRFDFHKIGERTALKEFPRAFDIRYAAALRTARP